MGGGGNGIPVAVETGSLGKHFATEMETTTEVAGTGSTLGTRSSEDHNKRTYLLIINWCMLVYYRLIVT